MIGRKLRNPGQYAGDAADVRRPLVAVALQKLPHARPGHLRERKGRVERGEFKRYIAQLFDSDPTVTEQYDGAENGVLVHPDYKLDSPGALDHSLHEEAFEPRIRPFGGDSPKHRVRFGCHALGRLKIEGDASDFGFMRHIG